jgi:hypothetical protein
VLIGCSDQCRGPAQRYQTNTSIGNGRTLRIFDRPEKIRSSAGIAGSHSAFHRDKREKRQKHNSANTTHNKVLGIWPRNHFCLEDA